MTNKNEKEKSMAKELLVTVLIGTVVIGGLAGAIRIFALKGK